MSTTTIHLPDYSEFQPNVDWAKAGVTAAIIRTSYGTGHKDGAWYGGQRRAEAHKHCGFVGFYHYLTAGDDPAQQARFAASIVGKLQPNEGFFLDLEESNGGDETPRAHAFMTTIDSLIGGHSGLYTGQAFFHAHFAGAFNPGGPLADRRFWIADYTSVEPPENHDLWQHTDSENHGGVTGDCSIFHGTAADLAALIAGKPSTSHGGGHGPTKTTSTTSTSKRGQANPNATPTPDWYHRVLKAGMTGDDVTSLQQTISPNHVTHTMDADTVTALEHFQHGRGLDVDGVCGPATAHQVAVYWHEHHS